VRPGPLPAAVLAAGAVLLLASCSPALAYACGTPDVPPVALDPSRCSAPPSDPVITDGARWWSAPAGDVAEPDEQPVPGQVLDGDWWDPADRHERATSGPSTARTAAPTTTRRAPRAPLPTTAAATSAPRSSR
jgi:hypothetical protein